MPLYNPISNSDFIDISKNLFDVNAGGVELGKYISNANGNMITHASYYTSNFIEIAPGDKYIVSTNGVEATATKILFYDENYNILNFVQNAHGKMTVPYLTPAVKYMRYSANTLSSVNKSQIERGTVVTKFLPYGYVGVKPSIGISTDSVPEKSIGRDKITDGSIDISKIESALMYASRNLFNVNDPDVIEGYYYDTASSLVKQDDGAASRYITSAYISVAPSTTYALSIGGAAIASYRVVFCGADKAHLTISVRGSEANGKFTVNAGTYYVRFSIPYAFYKNFIQLEKDDITRFVPYNAITTGNGVYISSQNVYQAINEQSISCIPKLDFYMMLSGAISGSDAYCSDLCIVDDDLWVFASSTDDHATNAAIYVFDLDLSAKTCAYNRAIPHNLGHCNTVSYCGQTDTLIVGNGSGDYSLAGEIIIIPNVKATAAFDYNSNDIVKINCESYNYGSKFNVCWAGAMSTRYDTCYLITDDNGQIRHLMLGKGSNDLGLGNFLQGKSTSEFNGSFKVIDSYTIDKCSFVTCNQGSDCWGGKLYVGVGHKGLWYWELTPKNNTIDKVEYYQKVYNAAGEDVSTNVSTEGITVCNSHIIIGRNDAIYFLRL